jgi:hypothetical protein
MRYLMFLLVMGLSVSGVRRLDWPTWAQVGAVIVVNLVAGAVIFGAQEENRDKGEQPEPK